jgi:ATP-dependent DNA ligase
LTRYFPELVAAADTELPRRCVLDGEIVIAGERGLDFEALQQRIHPAASRVRLLAEQTPASFIAFDLLALGNDDLTGEPFEVRRAALVDALAGAGPVFHVTPATTELAVAQRWFSDFEGAGFDGVVAKPLSLPYQPDKRVMFKIKHQRTADCVVAGYRVHKSGDDAIGSLLLGLYDGDTLVSVGVIGAFPLAQRRQLCARTKRRAGTPARTCPSFRCAPNGSSRCATTTWRAGVSGTPPISTAGGRTATPAHAPTPNSNSR